MKAHYKTASGRITFEVEGGNAKELFRELASIQEVFDAEQSCGVCKGTGIRFQARKVDDFDFYELTCTNPTCRARFSYGQAKKGGALFPKRKDEDGHWLPNGGWSKYEPRTNGEAAASSAINPNAPKQQRRAVPPADDWGITDADIPSF